MLFRQFCRLRPTSSRWWSWHSVPVSKRRVPFSFTPSVRFRHNLPHWSIREGPWRWCLSMIMKFTYSFFCWSSFSGLVSVKFLFSRTKDFTLFFSECYFKLRNRKRRPFVSERDVRQDDFRTISWLPAVFACQNFDTMLGFQFRDKWSLNNYVAI